MSYDKTAIEEANKHLLAMNKRVVELGAMLNDKTVRLENIEKENQAKIEVIVQQKDAEIENKSIWLESTQAEIRRLKMEMTQKDHEINQLRLKAGILERVIRYKPELTALLNCLNEFDTIPVSEPQSMQINLPNASEKIVTDVRQSHGASNGKLTKLSTPQSTLTDLPSATITDKQIATNDQHSESTSNGTLSVSSADGEDAGQPRVMKHKAIVWTPKDRSTQHGDSLQSNGTNQPRKFSSKIPGGAMKHEYDATQLDSDNLDARVMNYETQL